MPKTKSTWIKAISVFNRGKDSYCIPRKNTNDYHKVKKIQQKIINIRGRKTKSDRESVADLKRIELLEKFDLNG
jgi:hypothetical protein